MDLHIRVLLPRFTHRRCLAILVMLVMFTVGCSLGSPVSAEADLFARMPAEFPMYISTRSLQRTLLVLHKLLVDSSPVYGLNIDDLFGFEGIERSEDIATDIKAVLARDGIDGARPAGMAIMFAAEPVFIGYLPVASEEKFRASSFAAGSEFLEIDPNGRTAPSGGALDSSDHVKKGWFLANDYAVWSSDASFLPRAATAMEKPQATALTEREQGTTEGADAVLVLNMEALAADTSISATSTYALLNNTFSRLTAGLSLGEENNPSDSLEILLSKRTESPAAPSPLTLRSIASEDAVFKLAFRQAAALVALSEAMTADSDEETPAEMRQVEAVLKALLRDEVAIAVELGAAGFPRLKLAVRPAQSEMIEMLLGLGGFAASRTGMHGATPIKTIDGIPPILGAPHFAVQEETLVASNSAAGVEEMLDTLDLHIEEDGPNVAMLHMNPCAILDSPILGLAQSFEGVPPEALELLQGMQPIQLQVVEDRAVVEAKLTNFFQVYLAVLLPAFTRASTAAQMASSQNNLKQIALILKMFSLESQGELYPRLAPTPGEMMFDAAGVYPEYLTDPGILVNPGAADRNMWESKYQQDPVSVIGDQHYLYLGFVVNSDAEAEAFANAYLEAVERGQIPDADLATPAGKIYRLREGVEYHFVSDINDFMASSEAQARIPTLLERDGVWPFEKVNVLYLDGHTEAVPAGVFPNTSRFWAAIERIDAADSRAGGTSNSVSLVEAPAHNSDIFPGRKDQNGGRHDTHTRTRDELLPQIGRSQNNLKQIGLILKMYANESAGELYPGLASEPGRLMFSATGIYPKYMSEPLILVNPAFNDGIGWDDKARRDPASIVDHQHYVYLGYAVADDPQVAALADAYVAAIEEGTSLDNLQSNDDPLYPLREGVERFFVTDISDPAATSTAQSGLPILVERRGAWPDDSVNVLYMDGHVEQVARNIFPNTAIFWGSVIRMESASIGGGASRAFRSRETPDETSEMPEAVSPAPPLDGSYGGTWESKGKISRFELHLLQNAKGSAHALGRGEKWTTWEVFRGEQDGEGYRLEGYDVYQNQRRKEAYALDVLHLNPRDSGKTLEGEWTDDEGDVGLLVLHRTGDIESFSHYQALLELASGAMGNILEEPEIPRQASKTSVLQGAELLLRRLGPIEWGMTVEQAEAASGERLSGDKNEFGNPTCYYVYPQTKGIGFMVEFDRIVRVDIDTPAISTLSKVRIGDSEQTLLTSYPNRLEKNEGFYDSNLTEYWFVPKDEEDKEYRLLFQVLDGRVVHMRAGKFPAVGYVERCL
jgi:prepilin-type processing-associated H-X9-DG protein